MGVFQSLELQQQKVSDLMEMCLQKDDIINKLQTAMDATVEEATRDVYKRLIDTSTCVFFSKLIHSVTQLMFLTESSGGVLQVGATAASGEMLLPEQEQR